MIRYRDLYLGLESLQIQKHVPVLVISDETLGGKLTGGEQTALTALMAVFDTMMMPAFSSRPMIVPAQGPEDNALEYTDDESVNQQADFFSPELIPDANFGKLVRLLLDVPDSRRSDHPLLSFAGLGVDAALRMQTIAQPWAPISELALLEGWVLLLGVAQNRNICLHLAESRAGRKQFTRWALTREGIMECTAMPGCVEGFAGITQEISDLARKVLMPSLDLTAYPIQQLLERVVHIIHQDPDALLCANPHCAFCAVNRRSQG